MGAAERIAKLGQGDDDRAVHEYEVPEEIRAAGAVDHEEQPLATIGCVVLKIGEELPIQSQATGAKLAHDLARRCLREVNGKRVSVADGTADRAFAKMGPLGRALLMNAYVDLHAPSEASVARFLASRKTKVGGG